MNDEISPSSVRAVTVTIDVIGVPELVMNALLPSMTHSSPSRRRAAVRVPPASLPASGSVRPNAPSARAGDEVGQPRGLLVVGAEAVDRVGAEARPPPTA